MKITKDFLIPITDAAQLNVLDDGVKLSVNGNSDYKLVAMDDGTYSVCDENGGTQLDQTYLENNKVAAHYTHYTSVVPVWHKAN